MNSLESGANVRGRFAYSADMSLLIIFHCWSSFTVDSWSSFTVDRGALTALWCHHWTDKWAIHFNFCSEKHWETMITIITPVIVNLAPIQSVNRAVRPLGPPLKHLPPTYSTYPSTVVKTTWSMCSAVQCSAHTLPFNVFRPTINQYQSTPNTPKYLPSSRALPTIHTCQKSLAMWLTANSRSSVMSVRSNLCQAFSNACVLVNHSDEGQLKCLWNLIRPMCTFHVSEKYGHYCWSKYVSFAHTQRQWYLSSVRRTTI